VTEEDLDTETLIFRQLDRVMKTASFYAERYTEPGYQGSESKMDMEQWSYKMLMSAKFLDSFLAPLKDEEEQQRVLDREEKKAERFNDNPHVRLMAKAQGAFEANVEILQEKNMVFDESASFVLEDADEDVVLEGDEDEVSEEVV